VYSDQFNSNPTKHLKQHGTLSVYMLSSDMFIAVMF